VFRSGELGRCCTIEPNCSGLSARLASASVTRGRALETCKPSCVSGAARHIFIHMVHRPLGVVGYVAAPELSSREGSARSHGTHGRIRAHLNKEVMSGAAGYVMTPKSTSAGRCGPKLQRMWQRVNACFVFRVPQLYF
jgi:hypothetical protein